MLFYADLLPGPSSISPYLHLQKTVRICTNPVTQHYRGRVGPNRGYAAEGWYYKNRSWEKIGMSHVCDTV